MDREEALYYEHEPPLRDGRTFVFVNALTGSTEMWSGEVCTRLRQAGHGTLCYNFRGQAATVFADDTVLSPAVIVDDLCRLLAEVAPSRPILVGLSIGGLFAARGYLRGAAAEGLVLINTLRKPGRRLDWINRAMVRLAGVGGWAAGHDGKLTGSRRPRPFGRNV